MAGIFGVLCSILLISALEFAPSECQPHREVRQIPGLSEGMDLLKKFTSNIPGADMFAKFPEMANEFVKKAEAMGDQFMKPRSRREVSDDQEFNLHRVARQIPGMDQGIAVMKSAGETFVKTGTDMLQKGPGMATDMMKKASEMGGQFMKPGGRRRRSPEANKKSNRQRKRCASGMTTVAPK